MSISSAAELLRDVVRHQACQKMNLSTVKGYLGELLVKQLLENEGVNVEHLGNQNGYDLRFVQNGRDVRIDVKMSLPKDEFRWGFEYWGWALQHANKKKGITASHLICVGCTKELEIESVFVVASNDVPLFPAGEKQFSKVLHGLVLPASVQTAASAPKSNMYQESQRLFAAGTVKKLTRGTSLAAACA
jgi:hypothetical protein